MTIESGSILELEAVKIRFFSQNDEAAFFEWIAKISSVKKFEGRGFSIFLYVDSETLSEEGLRDLIALFRRYNISMKQLSVFDRKPFSEWFHNENAYWFCEVFNG